MHPTRHPGYFRWVWGSLVPSRGAGLSCMTMSKVLLDLLCDYEQITIPLWAWNIYTIDKMRRLDQAPSPSTV